MLRYLRICCFFGFVFVKKNFMGKGCAFLAGIPGHGHTEKESESLLVDNNGYGW